MPVSILNAGPSFGTWMVCALSRGVSDPQAHATAFVCGLFRLRPEAVQVLFSPALRRVGRR
eukprot:3726675-Rhodomonas_salina.1